MKKELVVGDIAQEISSSRRMLERVQDEHLAWKPHPKSMSLGGLATHVTNLLSWQVAILRHGEFDLDASPPRRDALPSRKAILDEFDRSARELEKALDATDEEGLAEQWRLRRGEKVLFRRPRAVALRIYGLSHLVHHRGQISVYLRLLDIPVPGIYGTSADDQEG